jgi:chromosome segregation ATPase
MTSVQENKNELEAAVRYCESAISRAKATIESMEFRQQAATKAWHEQTGREEALQREVAELKVQLGEREDKWDDAMNENRELHMKVEELKTNMALMTDELEELRGIIDRMGDDSAGDSVTIKQLYDDNAKLRETNNLQRDQIAMFQRKMSRLNEVNR